MDTPPVLPPIQSFDHPPLGFGPLLPPEPAQFPLPSLHSPTNAESEVPEADTSMDLSNSTIVIQPVPPLPDGQAMAPPPQNLNNEEGSGREDEDDDDDDDDDEEEDEDNDEEGDDEPEFPWHPIEEDKSVPCEDEVAYIDSKPEHSATEHEHWEQEAFFDLKDPEITVGESGRIDWLVEGFNGTKEKPNKELIMKSPIVRIGGYDWQIKFYPKGNRTDFLSVYLECVTMLDSIYQDRSELANPAFPVHAGSPKTMKRNSVAAQLAVVMYNPAEPRVHESKTDAHQFHKKAADFGWMYFTRDPRYDFHLRRHGQRQAILRDDKLAFTAYIRIIHDPTGCMYDRTFPSTDSSIAATGLRPFDSLSAQIAAIVPLLHLRQFRDFLYKHNAGGPLFTFMQVCLDKMLNRRLKRKHLKHSPLPDGRDVVEIWQKIRNEMVTEAHPEILREFDDLLSTFSSETNPICSNRLKTRSRKTIQQAVRRSEKATDSHPVLTMELERQTFNRDKRKWEKVTNRVELDDTIRVGSSSYKLYAFVTHSGPLGSPNYTSYVRPGGVGTRWYGYETNQVRALTQKQAKDSHCGSDESAPRRASSTPLHTALPLDSMENDALAYLVMYIREDFAKYTFACPAEEHWDVPETVRKPNRAPELKQGKETSDDVPDQSSEKTPVAAAAAFDSSAAIELHAADNLPPPPIPPPNVMDGDDVVMSDVEDDGSQTPYHFDRGLAAPPAIESLTSTAVAQDKERSRSASPVQEEPTPAKESTQPYTVDFFSSELYNGSALSNGSFHGQGHLIATNGDEYTGAFSNGLPHGIGTMIYATTGNIYTGAWVSGKHEGQGTYTELATGNVFEGGWLDGRRHGAFVLRGTVTDDDKGRCQICYEHEMNTAFYECGHVLACSKCASKIDTCPVCRKRVSARIELFGVKVSME